MKLYLAGSGNALGGILHTVPRQLFSFFYRVDEDLVVIKGRERFLDSGAFSAFTKGVCIDIEEYINFVKIHKKYLEVYANLDVIGDARGTLKNQKIMENAGLEPLPCFHFGEDIKYLDHYIDNYSYLALGMAGNKNARVLSKWLDRCFSKICDGPGGLPKIKIHGFAVTSIPLIFRYPWFSVDSTSWLIGSMYYKVFVPWGTHRLRRQSIPPSRHIHVGYFASDEEAFWIDRLPQSQKDLVLNYLKETGFNLGKSAFRLEKKTYELRRNEKWSGAARKDETRQVETIIEPGLRNDVILRGKINILYFQRIEKETPAWPWSFKHSPTNGFNL